MSFDNILTGETAIVAGLALVTGYVVFLTLLYFLPRKLRKENQEQKAQVLQKAHKRREQILAESRKLFEHKLALTREELDDNIKDQMSDLTLTEEELASQERLLQQTESRLQKQAKDSEAYQAKVATLQKKYQEDLQRVEDLTREMQTRLETLAQCNAKEIKKNLEDNYVADRQLESQKQLKEFVDDLGTHSKKMADRMLSRLLSRYSPEFIWPKNTNHVEIADARTVELLQSDKHPLLQELRELTEHVEIDFTKESENGLPVIKLVGGYGIYKEAAKLTLEEIVNKGPNAWAKAGQVYQRHRQALEKMALKLGRQAVRELQIENMHDEILKMVGALNWRTSYRQNQYYHSLEVAKLAGILAFEVGVDPDEAKRCGLLHDIGKGIDYRIEGSHAVISGDYADRFGERRLICDTVMSHHNDLVLETPLSYVLKTADTLSGARPGARVNLEEGYQIRLSAIDQAVRSFQGIAKVAIMSGGREVHIDVNHKKVREEDIAELTKAIARKIEEEVAFPGQIKVLVTRRFEATAVA